MNNMNNNTENLVVTGFSKKGIAEELERMFPEEFEAIQNEEEYGVIYNKAIFYFNNDVVGMFNEKEYTINDIASFIRNMRDKATSFTREEVLGKLMLKASSTQMGNIGLQVADNIFLYPTLACNGMSSLRVYRSNLLEWGISVEEAIRYAASNTLNATRLYRMGDAVRKFTPASSELIDDIERAGISMLCVSNATDSYGAAGAFLIKEFYEDMDMDIIIIPSSIHECLLLPYVQGCEDEVNQMIKGINTILKEEEILSDHAYLWSRKEQKIISL